MGRDFIAQPRHLAALGASAPLTAAADCRNWHAAVPHRRAASERRGRESRAVPSGIVNVEPPLRSSHALDSNVVHQEFHLLNRDLVQFPEAIGLR